MVIFLLIVVGVVVVIAWKTLRARMASMERQMAALTARVYAQEHAARRETPAAVEPAPVPPAAAPPKPEPLIHIIPPAPAPVLQAAPNVDASARATRARRSWAEWEALLGGNWLNKVGVLLVVISIALGLGYSFTHLGAVGIVSISLAGSIAMLIAGILLEARERYRVFARGLISGGWAALYVTVYSMHSVAAAKVIENPVAGAVLLLAVAAGMIGHSLRYRSEIVSVFAYFIAFFTLAITQSTPLSLTAMVPLEASLLYLAHRLQWPRLALGGLIATYATCALRPDTGAPLWQAQAIFATYWLLFEIYDIVQADTWLLPLNAVGVLGLSLIKWQRVAHHDIWMLLAAASAVYLVDALIRNKRGRWQGAITLAAGLAAAAIFQRLDQQWVATALVLEAELVYLAGWRLRAPYLRWLGTALFALEGGRLVADVMFLPVDAWGPVAAADAVVFYANRFLCASDLFFGWAGAAAAALVVGYKAPDGRVGLCWLTAAAVPIACGWWRRWRDIRLHGYALGVLGLIGAGVNLNGVSLASAAIFSYALAICALRSTDNRMGTDERSTLRLTASLAVTAAVGALVWRVADPAWLGILWMGAAVVLMEIGLAGWPREIGGVSIALVAIGVVRLLGFDVSHMGNHGVLLPRLIPAGAAMAAYWIAYRARPIHEQIPLAVSWAAAAFAPIAIWALAPDYAVAAIWALFAVGLLAAGLGWKNGQLQAQACALAFLAYIWRLADLLSGSVALAAGALAGCAATIACFYGAQLLAPRGKFLRLYSSLLGTTLTGLLLYNEISGRMLTIAWGIQGVVLLAAGFPLRDRALRLSGLIILLSCILKLFVYDLSYLDTLPRIFSFLVLGLILVAVSWVYTRFRDRVARYL